MPKACLVTPLRVVALALAFGGCHAQSAEIEREPLPLLEATCSAEFWSDETRGCIPLEEAFVSEGGQTYWVDQQHGSANDQNSGTRQRPWRTIGRAVETLRPGDAVIVGAGVYRESIRPNTGGTGPDRRITYAAMPAADVIVTGADVTLPEGWIRDGDAWLWPWTGPELPAYSDEGDSVMRREMVIADGEVLRVVHRREDVQPGTFFVEGSDVAQQAILARFPDDRTPAEVGLIEVAHRTFLFRPTGENPYPECGEPDTPGWLHVIGFTFRHAANRAQWGAFCAGSEGALVENVTVEWTNGAGVDGSGRNHTFRNVAANYNGQIGFAASCQRCLFEDSEAVGNNWKGYDPFWEAGGGKWNDTHQTIIRRHYAADNGGPGIWLDGGNSNNTIEESVAMRNDVAGIMLELATTNTLVQHNLIVNNRWRGYSGAGILSQAASHNVFIHNTIIGNEGNGIWLRLDPDGRADDGHNVLFNNVLAGNAWTEAEEGREITVEGASLEHSRTNRFEGNVYGRHAVNDLRTSAFFFIPDAAEEAGFRSGDLARWQLLTGGDRDARLIDPRGQWVASAVIPQSELGQASVLPEWLSNVFAGNSEVQSRAIPGADYTLLPRRINLSPR